MAHFIELQLMLIFLTQTLFLIVVPYLFDIEVDGGMGMGTAIERADAKC